MWRKFIGLCIAMLQHVIEAVGSTKAGARAQAAMQMMQAAGFIEHVDDKDRQAATAVVNLVDSKKVGSCCFISMLRLWCGLLSAYSPHSTPVVVIMLNLDSRNSLSEIPFHPLDGYKLPQT